MNTPHSSNALVLGGGGSTGNAWLIGVIAGLYDVGVDVTDAELIIGTSAGSTAAAQISGTTPTELFAQILAATLPIGGGRARVGAATNLLQRTNDAIAAASDASDMRRKIAAVLDAQESDSERWRTTVASRLPSQDWPDRRIMITAVDADTGEPVVFERSTGVALADAVAASCAGGFSYPIGSCRYIDGGYRRNENADLAAGSDRVLVLAPLGGQTRHPLEWGLQLATQVEELRAGGSAVETIFPDGTATQFFGPNAMDLSLRPAAAQAGYDQGKRVADRLAEFWI